MAISECNTTVDRSGRELLVHGTTPFPIACYHDDFRQMDVPWHWHEEWEAVYITEGSCTVAAGQQKIRLRAGEGFFINSGILHGCWDTDNTGCRFHSLVFHPRLVGGSLDSVYYQRYVAPLTGHPAMSFLPLMPSVPWQADALRAIDRAWLDCSRESPGYEFAVRASLSELVCLLCRAMPAAQPLPSTRSLRDGGRIKTMLRCIHDHFGTELTTAQIAASASVSESECLRCFRTTIGTTPIRYLKQYRLQQAAQQLLETGDRIQEIASRCGFQDMSYFTRAFREEKGCTPSAYREANQKSQP